MICKGKADNVTIIIALIERALGKKKRKKRKKERNQDTAVI